MIDASITEALRLASGSMIMRIVTQDNMKLTLPSTSETFHFRKGDRVGICPPMTHYVSTVSHCY